LSKSGMPVVARGKGEKGQGGKKKEHNRTPPVPKLGGDVEKNSKRILVKSRGAVQKKRWWI